MSDIIATVWDFDKTLIPGYMQEPIFLKYNFSGEKFWDLNKEKIAALKKQKLSVNEDSYYLNQLISFSGKKGKFEGLNNETLRELGGELNFYPGVEELFKDINALNDDKDYREYGITFENYIVSTGLKQMIAGSKIAEYVKHIWGAELEDVKEGSLTHLGKIAYSLDNTTKTRALFEINKGVGIVPGASIDVNTKIPWEQRRVQFSNMIYIADGPSDVPAFSVTKQKGGVTLAVYPRGNAEALAQVENLRCQGRVDMIVEANYEKGTTAYLWLMRRLRLQAEKIIEEKKRVYLQPAGTPSHLI